MVGGLGVLLVFIIGTAVVLLLGLSEDLLIEPIEIIYLVLVILSILAPSIGQIARRRREALARRRASVSPVYQ